MVVLMVGGMVALPNKKGSAQTEHPSDDAELTVVRNRMNSGTKYHLEGRTSQESTGTNIERRAWVTRKREIYYVTFPTIVTQSDGTRCLQVRRRAYTDAASAGAATDAQDALWRMTAATFPLCPRTPAPATSPSAQAAEFWRVAGEDLLPRPAPRIAPGYMLAGKLAYLETGTDRTARFEHPTPLGLLTIEATSSVFVDWGDGSGVQGPYDGPGGPWPDGDITHAWTHARAYDVVVTQRWTGRWELGGDSGELAGLVTEGRIDDFPVRELQAVRNF